MQASSLRIGVPALRRDTQGRGSQRPKGLLMSAVLLSAPVAAVVASDREEAASRLPAGFSFKTPHDYVWKPDTENAWTPPNTRLLIVRFHVAEFLPTYKRTLPRGRMTFGMPAEDARFLALSLNHRELTEGQADGGRWFVVVKLHAKGFAVMRVARGAGWQPTEPSELPPGVRPEIHANVPAIMESERHNQAVLDEGIVLHFNWCFPITPLIPCVKE